MNSKGGSSVTLDAVNKTLFPLYSDDTSKYLNFQEHISSTIFSTRIKGFFRKDADKTKLTIMCLKRQRGSISVILKQGAKLNTSTNTVTKAFSSLCDWVIPQVRNYSSIWFLKENEPWAKDFFSFFCVCKCNKCCTFILIKSWLNIYFTLKTKLIYVHNSVPKDVNFHSISINVDETKH